MAFNDISLNGAMRSNLISLQNTTMLLGRTQDRLSTGKYVNTALDNPLNYFTAKSLNSRAADLAGYKDGMSEAVQTIKAANAGITAIEGLLAQAKAVAAQAKAGTEGGSGDYSNATFTISADADGNTTVTQDAQITFGDATLSSVGTNVQITLEFTALTVGDTITIDGVEYEAVTNNAVSSATSFVITGTLGTLESDLDSLETAIEANGGALAAPAGTNSITLQMHSGIDTATLSYTSAVSGATLIDETFDTATELEAALSDTEFLTVDSGGAALSAEAVAENLLAALEANNTSAFDISLRNLTINILNNTDNELDNSTIDVAGTTGITDNSYQTTADRLTYAKQFNDIMDQLDLLSADSGYKGINFLEDGNELEVKFGSNSGDSITISSFDGSSVGLLGAADKAGRDSQNFWEDNDDIDADLTSVNTALDTLKSESSRLSSGLSIINTRQDWVKAMINTLTEGSDKLTLADMNEEGANMLMLQTRQTLGTTALSMSAQAAQSVLRLFA